MKKNLKKVMCLSLLLTMLMGMGGCALMMKNMMPENVQQNVLPELEKDQGIPKVKEDEIKEQVQDIVSESTDTKTEEKEDVAKNDTQEEDNKKEEPKKPSAAEEDLMSEYFKAKMELLATLVDQYYMNDISVEDMRIGAYKGLLEGLGDPYTCYYTAEEFDALMESTSGTYYGIGAVVQQNLKTMYITIVKPYVDGPAYKAGMLPGDIIYMVDDVDVTGMEIDNVVAMMKGPEGTQVKVTVIRDGESEPVELLITRAQITIETIEYEMLDNNIGYILISSFDEPTPKQFKEAVEDLKKQGMKGLVIDLRDNPGGLLDAVVEMLDYVLPEGMIVYTEDKYGNRDEYKGTDKNVLELPMSVIINGNSASAAEIFAAAMQDYEAANIVGTTSFGKGIVQSILPLTDGTAVKITVASYFTPRGVCIHGVGVVPDMEVELKEELKQMVVIPHDQDNQLAVAIAVILSETK
ncbi:MAG: S41 family peptidase [Lachnospiraceae bacterium]|nr:S41 family peptidase [Lachnospiraceae bacterium]